MLDLRNFRAAIVAGGLALFLSPLPMRGSGLIPFLNAQSFSGRLRRPPALPAPQEAPPAPASAPPAAASAEPEQAGTPTALPPSMLESPAQPAKIELANGTLSIQADNSSLEAILHAVASQSGMQIQGLDKDPGQGQDKDERVFGNFGPGKPRDVLAGLLDGTPYNLLMVGDLADGAPRQLILSPASGPAARPLGAASSTPQADEDEDDNSTTSASPPPAPTRPVDGSPPAANPQAVKTPQQLFQELQAMRQQQQQQQK